MKRIITLVITAALLLSLAACKKDKVDLQEPVMFYYCNEEISYNSSNGVIREEMREGAGHHGDIQLLLNDYLCGPVSSDLYSLVPEETRLLSCDIVGNKVTLEFNASFAELSGIQLSTACSCIVMTLNAYAGIDTVHFRAANSQLENQNELILRISDLVFMDSVSEKEG